MKADKLEFKSPDDVEAVYYEAFRHCDSDVMAALWADGDVICVHPGAGVLLGHAAVARSWKHILENSMMPEIDVTVIQRTQTDELAVHLVTEEIEIDTETVIVLATNVYQKGDSGWLMVEHHASVVETQQETHTLQ